MDKLLERINKLPLGQRVGIAAVALVLLTALNFFVVGSTAATAHCRSEPTKGSELWWSGDTARQPPSLVRPRSSSLIRRRIMPSAVPAVTCSRYAPSINLATA